MVALEEYQITHIVRRHPQGEHECMYKHFMASQLICVEMFQPGPADWRYCSLENIRYPAA